MRRVLWWMAGVAAVVVSLPAGLGAQVRTAQAPERTDRGVYLDYYVSRYQPAARAEGSELEGVGGRLMWSLAPLRGLGGSGWLDRALMGGYLTHTSEDGERMEVLRYGAQADYRVTRTPLAGRVSPLVSLAVGALRVTEPGEEVVSVRPVSGTGDPDRLPRLLMLPPGPERTTTGVSVVPGIGARVRLLPGLNFRTDARQVIDFREGTHHNLELSAGLSLGA